MPKESAVKKKSIKHNGVLLKIIILLMIIVPIMSVYSYASWYEEPLAIERTDFDKMWWLSRRKKDELRKKEEADISRKREEYNKRNFKEKNIKWLYDDSNITKFPKGKWEVIDDDGDNVAYEYYFDENGYLLIDTITPDYEIVDDKGRRLDSCLKVITYTVSEKESIIEEVDKKDATEIGKKTNAEVIIGKGVKFKEKVKIYDNSVDKDALIYIDSAGRFVKETKGTTINDVRWKKCSSMRCSDGFVIIKNPNNNFNKLSFIASLAYYLDVKEED